MHANLAYLVGGGVHIYDPHRTLYRYFELADVSFIRSTLPAYVSGARHWAGTGVHALVLFTDNFANKIHALNGCQLVFLR